MRAFGARAEWEGADALRVRAGVHYRARRYAVEADASSAAYPFCAAAIVGGRVRVEGLDPRTRQPDVGILGCSSRWGAGSSAENWAEVEGPPAGPRVTST
jgi:3-phosphoshikimate 1-carboxyvinyltransferase